MYLKVPKFDFEDLAPAKPTKVANSELTKCNLSNFSDISYGGVEEINFHPPLVQPTQGPEGILTCYECGHFLPAVNSPNPTQAWGHCRKRNKGRFGMATACEHILTSPPRGGFMAKVGLDNA